MELFRKATALVVFTILCSPTALGRQIPNPNPSGLDVVVGGEELGSGNPIGRQEDKNSGSSTDQLYLIIQALIKAQQRFEASTQADLKQLRAAQKELESKLLQEMSNVRSSVAKSTVQEAQGEFYPNKATLFKGLLSGDKWDINVPTNKGTCENLPSSALNRISGIETNGNCVILYKERNCSGRGVRFQDHSYGYDDFGRIGFHDQATSYRSC